MKAHRLASKSLFSWHHRSFTTPLQRLSSTMAKQYLDLPIAPADIAFGLMADFEADTHPNKVSLIAGAYRDEKGEPWILPSVKKVIKTTSQHKTQLTATTGKRAPQTHPRIPRHSRFINLHNPSKRPNLRTPHTDPPKEHSLNPNSLRHRRKPPRSYIPSPPRTPSSCLHPLPNMDQPQIHLGDGRRPGRRVSILLPRNKRNRYNRAPEYTGDCRYQRRRHPTSLRA